MGREIKRVALDCEIPTNKEIAATLRAIALTHPVEAWGGPVEIYRAGSFVLRCRPYREAVLRMAARFDSAPNDYATRSCLKPRISTRRSYNEATFKQFIVDGELENAIAYRSIRHPVYFGKGLHDPLPIANAQEVLPGFIVGRVYHSDAWQPWHVTHLATGMTAGRHEPGNAKAEAIKAFKELPADKLQEALDFHTAKLPEPFQITARRFYGLSTED
jgi:hypothetical protein